MTSAPVLPELYLKQRHVKLLLALDRFGQLGQAARSLHMSQPAASRSLAQLEEQIGQVLFDRSGTGTQPTPIGDLVIAHARYLAASAQRLAADTRAWDERKTRLLRIGVLASASIHIVPRLVSDLLEHEPSLEVTVYENLLHQLLEALSNGKLDCVIGRTGGRINSTEVEEIFLYKDPVSLICGATNPLIHEEHIRLEDLMEHRWILPVKGTVLGDRIDHMFARFQLTPPVRQIQSNAVLANIMLINKHPWITPLAGRLALYFQKIERVRILPLDTRVNFGSQQLMIRRGERNDPAVALVLRLLQQYFAEE
jgi:DNA-binding transcriptional LysR family regulator